MADLMQKCLRKCPCRSRYTARCAVDNRWQCHDSHSLWTIAIYFTGRRQRRPSRLHTQAGFCAAVAAAATAPIIKSRHQGTRSTCADAARSRVSYANLPRDALCKCWERLLCKKSILGCFARALKKSDTMRADHNGNSTARHLTKIICTYKQSLDRDPTQFPII